jgi:hypothetical protein
MTSGTFLALVFVSYCVMTMPGAAAMRRPEERAGDQDVG